MMAPFVGLALTHHAWIDTALRALTRLDREEDQAEMRMNACE